MSLTKTGDTSAASGLAVDRFDTAQGGKISYERGSIQVAPEVADAISKGQSVVVIHGVDHDHDGKYSGDTKSDLDPSLPTEATDPALCGALRAAPTGGMATGDGGAWPDQRRTDRRGRRPLLGAAGTGIVAARRAVASRLTVLTARMVAVAAFSLRRPPPSSPSSGCCSPRASRTGRAAPAGGRARPAPAATAHQPRPAPATAPTTAPGPRRRRRRRQIPRPPTGSVRSCRHPPRRLEIPSIGVALDRFVDLGIAADGSITVPGSADEVLLHRRPDPGPARPGGARRPRRQQAGPGIFYRLGAVKVGGRSRSVAPTGRPRRSASTRSRPTRRTTSPRRRSTATSPPPEIRLVTCGGPFDKVKHYLDNVVVFAHLVSAA